MMREKGEEKSQKRRGCHTLLDSLRREYDRWGGGVNCVHCVSRARSARTWSGSDRACTDSADCRAKVAVALVSG